MRFVIILADLDESMEAGFDEAANCQRSEQVLVLVDEIGSVALQFVAGVGIEIAVGCFIEEK